MCARPASHPQKPWNQELCDRTVSSVIQMNGILFTYAKCIDRNMTHVSVIHGDVNKSTEVPAALQLLQSNLKKVVTFKKKKSILGTKFNSLNFIITFNMHKISLFHWDHNISTILVAHRAACGTAVCPYSKADQGFEIKATQPLLCPRNHCFIQLILHAVISNPDVMLS